MQDIPPVRVRVTVAADAERAWHAFTDPQSITQWNFASPDWSCPTAENDLRVGGEFRYRMAAKDGSMAFDFSGRFDPDHTASRELQQAGWQAILENFKTVAEHGQ